MDGEALLARYRDLQSYVGWTESDCNRIVAVAPTVTSRFPALIDDFYEEIARHPEARSVITGGTAQIERLKGMLRGWLAELFSGRYDLEYVTRRWRVGWRHVEIGLPQVYTNAALSRLRFGLSRAICEAWQSTSDELQTTLTSLHKLLDLDLAIIEEAYQSELIRRKEIEASLREEREGLELRVRERTVELARANEVLREEINERQRAQNELLLLKNLALSIGESRSLENAMRITMRYICETTGWDCGEVWLADEEGRHLRMRSHFTLDDSLLPFHHAGAGIKFKYGHGLPGKVWATRDSLWINDLATHAVFTRAAAAAAVGLTAGFGVPVFSGDTFVAVLAFFERDTRGEDRRLLQLVSAAVAPLGPIIERRRLEDELANHKDRLEQTVAERTAQLHQADRLASIGTLAAGLGHDMNNVLLPTRARLDVLEAEADTEHARTQIAAIRRALNYLQQLTDGLHLLSLDPNNAEATGGTTNLHAWWGQTGSLLAKTLPKSVKFQSEFASDLPEVAVPAHRLTQAVLNLLVNAGEAIHGEGTVRLTAELDANGERVCVSVGDTGEGMTEEVKRRALDPFFTTKTRGLGTGLGLSLVQGVVHAANGSVTIDSKRGVGTKVTMRLPVAGAFESGADGSTANAFTRRAVVSVADACVTSYIESVLASLGYLVEVADEGVVDSEPCTLWVLDPTCATAERVRSALSKTPNMRLIVIGRSTSAWGALHAHFIDDPTDIEMLRRAATHEEP
ncbi:MAG TPA: protoglobin domain-containing protein [Phycisphaerales bacterium]|nr:protoglobin domain-containing protein [Phycisphaerales bacterium]